MRRGTTPTVTLRISNADGSPCDLEGAEIHVAFLSGSGRNAHLIVKTQDDITVSVEDDETVLSVPLTQEDTLSFTVGKPVQVQMRSRKDGVALASGIAQFDVEPILEEGEI